MAISVRQIGAASDFTNTHSTLDITGVNPAANEEILVVVGEYGTSVTSVTGCGITFTRITTASINSGDGTLELWAGSSASPTTGTVTVHFGGNAAFMATIAGATGFDGFGTAVTQTHTASPSLSTAALYNSNSVTFSGCVIEGFSDQTLAAGTDSTLLATQNPTATQRMGTEYRLNNVTQAWTTGGTGSNATGSFNIELKSPDAGNGVIVTDNPLYGKNLGGDTGFTDCELDS